MTKDQELLRIKDMLSNMLPTSISSKIQDGNTEIAEDVDGTVVFIDFPSFTQYVYVTTTQLLNLTKKNHSSKEVSQRFE